MPSDDGVSHKNLPCVRRTPAPSLDLVFPPDSHVHTEWSYDAAAGSMHASCERALEFGLSAIAFTEHVDHTVWTLAADGPDLDGHLARFVEDGQWLPPQCQPVRPLGPSGLSNRARDGGL